MSANDSEVLPSSDAFPSALLLLPSPSLLLLLLPLVLLSEIMLENSRISKRGVLRNLAFCARTSITWASCL